MKPLIGFLTIMALATPAIGGSPEFEINNYPGWIKNSCLEITKTKTRVSSKYNWDEALACAARMFESYQEERLRQSQIDANNARAELDRELAREIRNR